MSPRVIDLSLGWTVVVDVGMWALVSTAVGYAAHRAPDRWFRADGHLTRLRRFERDGRWYEQRLRIRSWKAKLPEAGGLFAGGFSKRHLRSDAIDQLERFIVETRRAETTHWVLLAAGPFFLLWNPWGLGLVMIAYAVAANVPCLLIQRYNRARLTRVVALAGRRSSHDR